VRTLRVYTCPKNLLNGPCGGALGEVCEVDGRDCPWTSTMAKIARVEPAMIFEEHPLLLELEDLVRGDSEPRASVFWKNLERGKAFSVEFPIAAVREEEDVVRVLGRVEADLLTVPDNPLGYPHVDPVAFGTYLKVLGGRAGVMPHITAKDRNLSAVASELRTAQLFNFEAVLLVTGDWPGHGVPSKPVFDLDSANLIRLARIVFAGVMPTREVFDVGSRPRVLGGMNPHYRPRVEARRMARKLIAGAEAFVTQVVATKESVSGIKAILEELGKYGEFEVPLVVSLLYPIEDWVKPLLERMGIPTGEETFEELIEEVKALDVGGVNLIVLSRDVGEWLRLEEEARKIVEGVFG